MEHRSLAYAVFIQMICRFWLITCWKRCKLAAALMLITYLHTLIYLNVYKFQKSHYLILRMSFLKKASDGMVLNQAYAKLVQQMKEC